jgi:hypothetical protein
MLKINYSNSSVGGTSVGAQGIAPLSWCKIAVPHGTGKRYS